MIILGIVLIVCLVHLFIVAAIDNFNLKKHK